MKYYVAYFDITDGDNEYVLQFLVHAANPADAEEKAIAGVCDTFGVDRSEWNEQENALDLLSRIIGKSRQPQEIPDTEAEILKKYFWVATEFTERQRK
jgi:hypothetical protein